MSFLFCREPDSWRSRFAKAARKAPTVEAAKSGLTAPTPRGPGRPLADSADAPAHGTDRSTAQRIDAMRGPRPDFLRKGAASGLGLLHLLASPFFSGPAEAATHCARARDAIRVRPSPCWRGPGTQLSRFDRPLSPATRCAERGASP